MSTELIHKAAMLVFDEGTSDAERVAAARLVMHKSGKTREQLADAVTKGFTVAYEQQQAAQAGNYWYQRARVLEAKLESTIKVANQKIVEANAQIKKGNATIEELEGKLASWPRQIVGLLTNWTTAAAAMYLMIKWLGV